MCVIAICDKRRMTKDEFKNCWSTNRDGVGIGWSEGSKVKYIKGLMSLENAYEVYEKTKLTFPHVVHFRLSTVGGVQPKLTHPFIVNYTSPVERLAHEGDRPILFHNGVVYDWTKYLTNMFKKDNRLFTSVSGPMSDTRFVALAVNKYGTKVIPKIQGGKYVIVFPDGKLWTYGAFEENKENPGVRFSNSSYKPYTYYGYGRSMKDLSWEDFPDDDDYFGYGGKNKTTTGTKAKSSSNQKDKVIVDNYDDDFDYEDGRYIQIDTDKDFVFDTLTKEYVHKDDVRAEREMFKQTEYLSMPDGYGNTDNPESVYDYIKRQSSKY